MLRILWRTGIFPIFNGPYTVLRFWSFKSYKSTRKYILWLKYLHSALAAITAKVV